MLVTIKGMGVFSAKKRKYPSGNGIAPNDYRLLINGIPSSAMITGGGIRPTYTYFMYKKVSYRLPKEAGGLPHDTRMTIKKAQKT